jgi:hypothetical protein
VLELWIVFECEQIQNKYYKNFVITLPGNKMPIDLHPKTLENLRPEIIKFVKGAMVNHGCVLDHTGVFDILYAAERLLPESGPRREALDTYIGDTSVLDFISDEVRRLLENKQYTEEQNPTSLMDVLQTDDAEGLADKLLESFQSLPWSYWAALPLSDALADYASTLDAIHTFSPNVRLLHDQGEIGQTLPSDGMIVKGTGLFGLMGGFSKPRACLQIWIEGFVERYGRSETGDKAVSTFRRFLGLGLALELFKMTGSPVSQIPRQTVYFRRIEGPDNIGATITLGDAETIAFHKLRYNDEPRFGSGLFPSDQEKLDAMAVILSDLSADAPLLRACEWLYNSQVGDDALLNFVQATVVLEILLGDKVSSDEVGLSALLANRCAYMIGATTSERNNILKDFKAIYSVRSQIVHTGKHRLSSKEKHQLWRLRQLGRRVIQKEVALAMAEVKRNENRSS